MATNAYRKRKALRDANRQKASAEQKTVRASSINHICEMYEHAYFTWTGQSVNVRYAKGWYYVGGIPMHERQVIDKTNRILAAIHEEELGECNEGT